jgi:hypothetical protein
VWLYDSPSAAVKKYNGAGSGAPRSKSKFQLHRQPQRIAVVGEGVPEDGNRIF